MRIQSLKSLLTVSAALGVVAATTGDVPAQADDANCRAEIARLCAHLSPGQGRVAECLKQSHWQLSPGCRDHTRVVEAALKETLQGCHDDMLLHCTRAEMAGSRGAKCLARKDGLSPSCSAVAKLL